MHLVSCGSGDPILFIHGMPTSGRLWNRIIERLCASYRCFAVDLPGFGKSPRAQYGPEYMKSLAERLDKIRIEHGIDKWHVVGHDAGAVVAVFYAHYFPQHVDRIALLSPALFPELKPYFLLNLLRKSFLGELLAPVICALFWRIAMRRALKGIEDTDNVVKQFHEPFSAPSGPWDFMRVMRWGNPAQILAAVPGFLPGLFMPTLIFHGAHDIAIPEEFARRASSLMPNAQMLKVDCGHFIPLNEPDFVATRLDRFFDASMMCAAD